MDPSSRHSVHICFFPFVGGGHQIPMVDTARVFESHGARATIITTPKHALLFQKLIERDQNSGRSICIQTLKIPDNINDIADTDMSATPFTDTSMLQEPLQNLLQELKPDCIVHDMFHRWSARAIDGLDIRRITFNGSGCFPRCVRESLQRHKPFDSVGSGHEPFVVPGLPDRIEMTRTQVPGFARKGGGPPRPMLNAEENSFGIVVNSFYELEPAYVEHFKHELGKKRTWLVGPVSMCNRNLEDKAERGKKAAIDEQVILNWLDAKEPHSVLYISFGSLARLAPAQLLEIAHGLEASNCSFIWVVGKIFTRSTAQYQDQEPEENWQPVGFEDRVRESGKGLIIKGWAPQLLILEHPGVGGFLTHCGWNSTLEGVSAGVPMVTWPITAEQFDNEKLIADVLKIGVKVGSMEWLSWDTEPRASVGRDMVEVAVKKLMDGGQEAAEMRRRAKGLREKAKKAVEEGGSSYGDVDALIRELACLKKN